MRVFGACVFVVNRADSNIQPCAPATSAHQQYTGAGRTRTTSPGAGDAQGLRDR
jgi:hypothetical protein